MAWMIERKAVEFILGAARNNYPKEFAGLLRGDGNRITEVILVPGTQWNERSALLFLNNLPLDPTVIGSVHSHPGPAIPSKADLAFFSKFGRIHLIAGYPYDFQNLKAFLPSGQETRIFLV